MRFRLFCVVPGTLGEARQSTNPHLVQSSDSHCFAITKKRGDDSIAISRFIISCLRPLPCDAIFPSNNNNNNNNVGCCKSRCGNRHSCPCARPNPFFHAPLSDTPATWRCLPLKMNQDAPVFFFGCNFLTFLQFCCRYSTHVDSSR